MKEESTSSTPVEKETSIPQPSQQQQPTLSKSWSPHKCHSTLYSGGTIVSIGDCVLIPPTLDDNDDKNNDDVDEVTTEKEEPSQPHFLAMCNEDIAFISSQGMKMGTLRTGFRHSGNNELEDDMDSPEDDFLDQDGILTFTFCKATKTIATASRNSIVRLYSLEHMVDPIDDLTDTVTFTSKVLGKEPSVIKTLEFHMSGAYLAVGCVDGSVKVWDARPKGMYATHYFRNASMSSAVSCLLWSPFSIQKKYLVLVVGRDDGSIALFDLEEKDPSKNMLELKDHTSSVTKMIWYEGEEKKDWLFTTGRDQILNVWGIVQSKISTKKLDFQREQGLPLYEQIEGMEIISSVTGEVTVYTAGSKGIIRAFQCKPKKQTMSPLTCTVTQPSSSQFGNKDGGYTHLLQHVSSSADPNKVTQSTLVAVDTHHNLSTLSIPTLTTLQTYIGHLEEVLDVKILSSAQIAVVTNSASILILSSHNFSSVVLRGHTDTVLSISKSPCGRYLSSVGKDRALRIWRLRDYKCVGVGKGHTEAIGSVSFSSKPRGGVGLFCVTASKDRTVKKWVVPDHKVLDVTVLELELKVEMSIRAHEKDINIVSVAPNDSLMATGSQDKTINIYSLVSSPNEMQLQGTCRGHKRGVWDVQFSPHDRVIASASGDKSIKLWSLKDCSCVRTFMGHLESVLRVRFLSGGMQLLSSASDGLVKLWTVRTLECEATLDAHTNKIWAMDLLIPSQQANPTSSSSEVEKEPNLEAHESILVSGGADSRLVIWKDTTCEQMEQEMKERQENILLEQRLSNYIRNKEYDEALELALDLKKPHLALKVLSNLIQTSLQNNTNPIQTLQPLLQIYNNIGSSDDEDQKNTTTARLIQLLSYIRDWNTSSRNAPTATILLRAMIETVECENLLSNTHISEILAGIVPYSERHLERMERLLGDSYLLDYVLFNMGVMGLEEEDKEEEEEYEEWVKKSTFVLPPNFNDDSGRKSEAADEDEVMTVGDDSTDSESSFGEDEMEKEKMEEDESMVDSSDSSSSSSSDSN